MITYFLRNDGFGSAREYFSQKDSNYKRNQFGVSFGGPIRKELNELKAELERAVDEGWPDEQVEALRHWANVVGSTGAPFDAWLTLRGLRTLFPRIERQQINAMIVAQYLERHPAVAMVHYPGLPSHPGHAIANRQQRGFGAAGAKIYVGAGNGAYLRNMMTSPHNVRKDALAKKPRAVEVIEVADKTVLSDGARSIELYRIANGHAEGMLIAYLHDVKLGYVTDLWAPGRDTEFGTARQRALVDAVEKAGIRPERFAGGHGGVASYPEFVAKVKAAK